MLRSQTHGVMHAKGSTLPTEPRVPSFLCREKDSRKAPHPGGRESRRWTHWGCIWGLSGLTTYPLLNWAQLEEDPWVLDLGYTSAEAAQTRSITHCEPPLSPSGEVMGKTCLSCLAPLPGLNIPEPQSCLPVSLFCTAEWVDGVGCLSFAVRAELMLPPPPGSPGLAPGQVCAPPPASPGLAPQVCAPPPGSPGLAPGQVCAPPPAPVRSSSSRGLGKCFLVPRLHARDLFIAERCFLLCFFFHITLPPSHVSGKPGAGSLEEPGRKGDN